MVQGQVFLKGAEGRGLALSLFNFFKVISFLHLEIFLPFFAFAKLYVMQLEEKLFFTATIILCTW